MSKKLLFFFTLIFDCMYANELAVIKIPIADSFLNPYYLTNKLYLAPDERNLNSCPRAHQFLFNEIGVVKKLIGDYNEIEVSNLFYQNESKVKKNTFWIHKNDLILLKELKKLGFNEKSIPKSFNSKMIPNVLVLISPWYDKKTNKTYSAGTRFQRANKDKDNFYSVFINDYGKSKTIISYVNSDLALINWPKTNKDKIILFVSILKKWANLKEFIPYVWGGNSFIKTYSNNNFYIINRDFKNSCWTRPFADNPTSGIDCSSLILRVAQICGLPYYFKNSLTILNNLKKLDKTETIEEGDIIWYKGHVLVISDLKDHKIVESAGYPIGYGKVHEIEISKVFQGISNFDELKSAFFMQKSLKRLHKNGTVKKVLDKFAILKLKSIF